MRALSTVAAAMTTAALLAGCGSSGSASSSKSSAGTTLAPGTPAVDPSAVAQLPGAIKSKGSLTVAMDATYAPDEFVAPDGRTIIGMDADMMQAVGQVLGLKINLVNATFNTIIPGLLSGKYDIGASSFTDTKQREGQVDFVTYASFGEGYYVPANSTQTFAGLDSLCGHKVSVESGTTEESDAQAQAKTCTTAGKATVTVLSFQDQNQANLAVSSGRADLGFSDSQVAAYIVQQANGQFKLSGQPFSTAPYGLAIPKNGMAQAVLAAVKDLMSDGAYTKVLAKWATQAGAITNPVVNGATS